MGPVGKTYKCRYICLEGPSVNKDSRLLRYVRPPLVLLIAFQQTMRTKGIQLSFFPPTKPLEEQTCRLLSPNVAPRWVFGRIDKKKGRHLWVLKQHPDAAVVCITHPLDRESAGPFLLP